MSLVPAVHLLPLVKSRNNESSPKLPFYTARLIADRAIICLLFNRFSTVLPEVSVYYTIVFPPFCQYAVKQTDERFVRLNDSTIPFKRNRNETITLYCHIPYLIKISHCLCPSQLSLSTFSTDWPRSSPFCPEGLLPLVCLSPTHACTVVSVHYP